MTTLRVDFCRTSLPRAFTWLAQHHCFISFDGDAYTALAHADEQLTRALASSPEWQRLPLDRQMSLIAQIKTARSVQLLDYTASIFDVLGIDISQERNLAGTAPRGDGEDGSGDGDGF